ncbi:fibronectin type III domain-containing protein [Thermosulfuriphilus ammonigenes]|uniref:Fibronectin type III domain-containing protein n=1 Tax=Thermosulfuriphilus ammonigenes TaxID=1936021 RepID=A0A6G7PVG2_9BACT|nr:fibronectin type III domain-containing protein [Thermosulfuriphilus ammonigenes]MBA2848156.1 putative small lipoprotein YifL [Thermosulfuriphilus ammonigenes]QIJ71669.1 fibronectin type III domain-containing protein [Thermosulfuriphilus ammonigenes]HFB83501.1 fibronectin type III domain-containing protein [Thermodesulfatator sp.]
MRLRALGLWLILFSILAGCGRKTPPLPPEQVAPRQVTGLRYELRVSGVKLTWKVPRRTLAGTPVGHLKGFEILKTEKVIGQGLTRSFKIFVPVDRDLDKVSSFGYEDSNLRSGCRYVYRVRAVRGFRSVGPFSAPVSFSWHSPPGPPEGLRLEAWDRKIYLFWRPPQSFLDGTPVDLPLRYRLWRGPSPEALKPLAVLVDGTSFFDGSVENEIRFCYRVAAVIQFYGTWIEGAPTEVLCAIPHDLTPPSAPRALVAVPVPEGIWLRWREAPEPDVAGYRVYRARKGKKFVPIHQGLIARPEYIDRTLPGPGVYVYRVTAVDDSPRANESPPSAPVEVEYKSKER